MCGVRGPRSERTQQEKTQVMAMNETEKIYRIGGYVKRAKLNLRGGKTFEIKADNLSKENKYVKSIRLNGKDISGRKTITYAEIMAGGILEFDMSNR